NCQAGREHDGWRRDGFQPCGEADVRQHGRRSVKADGDEGQNGNAQDFTVSGRLRHAQGGLLGSEDDADAWPPVHRALRSQTRERATAGPDLRRSRPSLFFDRRTAPATFALLGSTRGCREGRDQSEPEVLVCPAPERQRPELPARWWSELAA